MVKQSLLIISSLLCFPVSFVQQSLSFHALAVLHEMSFKLWLDAPWMLKLTSLPRLQHLTLYQRTRCVHMRTLIFRWSNHLGPMSHPSLQHSLWWGLQLPCYYYVKEHNNKMWQSLLCFALFVCPCQWFSNLPTSVTLNWCKFDHRQTLIFMVYLAYSAICGNHILQKHENASLQAKTFQSEVPSLAF